MATATAGYSGTPLIRKLGIKPGHRLVILQAPARYDELLGPLPDGVRQLSRLAAPLDFVQLFTSSKGELEARFPGIRKALKPDGMLWISWPKRSSKVETDLSENVVREIGLRNGLVDVKVAAVDETWSGLKFVFRLKDRP